MNDRNHRNPQEANTEKALRRIVIHYRKVLSDGFERLSTKLNKLLAIDKL